MSVRTINYSITKDGISPSIRQKGGVQGEHRITELVFTIEPALFSQLQDSASSFGGKLIYNFETYNATGFLTRTDLKDLTENKATFALENWLTRYGGNAKVVLVIACCKEATSEIELVSYPAELYFKNLPDERVGPGEDYQSMLTLGCGAKESAQQAEGFANLSKFYANQSSGYAGAAKIEADRATAEADRAAGEVERAKAEADRARDEADRAGTAWVNALPISATCYNEAAASKPTTNDWFISKTMGKPSVHNGMMVNVRWVNGRVDGVGYDIRLIYGEPDGAENEILIDSTSVIDAPSGMINIPTDGTIVYQLVIKDGRNHWKYISGDVLKANFSSATSATVADKLVPNLNTNYLPGMEIYLQLDDGNTADVMRLVPDEGETLPVYGNGIGKKSGDIEKGYILHLKNAGTYWQIINGGITKGFVEDELKRPQHNTMVVSVHTEGIGVKADYKASEIKRHKDGGGVVLLNLDAALTQGTGEQTYLLETVKNGKAIFRRPVISTVNETVSRVIVTVDENYNVEMTEDILPIIARYKGTELYINPDTPYGMSGGLVGLSPELKNIQAGDYYYNTEYNQLLLITEKLPNQISYTRAEVERRTATELDKKADKTLVLNYNGMSMDKTYAETLRAIEDNRNVLVYDQYHAVYLYAGFGPDELHFGGMPNDVEALSLVFRSDESVSLIGNRYMPPATARKLGGVKVGSGLDVTPDGTLSAILPVNTFKDISIAAQNSTASKRIEIGELFYANRTTDGKLVSIPWHVADIIPFITPEGNSQEAVIIQQHRVLPEEIMFDAYEAFYVAKDKPLEAGTYHVTFKEDWGTYHKAGDSWSFTLTKPVPIGGCLGGFHDTPYSGFGSANVQSFNSLTDTTPIETANLRSGAEGTKLGDFTFKGNNVLNSIQRTCYGYNNYKQSFQRQYFNNTGKGWWKAQNEYDLPPTNYADINGFMTGWDENFLKYLRPFKQTTIRNYVTDNSEEDVTEDIFTLPSLEQMYIKKQVSGEGESLKYWKEVSGSPDPFPWYKETPELIHLDINGTPRYVRLRSALVSYASNTWLVNPSGYVSNLNARGRFCGAPLAIIY